VDEKAKLFTDRLSFWFIEMDFVYKATLCEANDLKSKYIQNYIQTKIADDKPKRWKAIGHRVEGSVSLWAVSLRYWGATEVIDDAFYRINLSKFVFFLFSGQSSMKFLADQCFLIEEYDSGECEIHSMMDLEVIFPPPSSFHLRSP